MTNCRPLVALLALLLEPCAPVRAQEGGCFAVIAGASTGLGGALLLGHNEDDQGEPELFHWLLPRTAHPPGTMVRLAGGGLMPEAPITWACIWGQMPGYHFSDFYLNEWGLALASNSCPSREQEPQITRGGIGFMLRRIVAQRARSAREGVELAGRLLDEWGYTASGRTLILADPREAWLLCMVRGKHWLAVRVPDDRVCAVANSYPVHEIDLEAPGVLGSKGLVEHARARGWYDPEQDGPFQFARAFADPAARNAPANHERQRRALELLGKQPAPKGWKQPLFFEPARLLGPADLFAVLRDTGQAPQGGSSDRAICCPVTVSSKVFQLRAGLPVGLGACLWLALGRPDASLFVPWHLGSLEAPEGYAAGDWREGLALTLEGRRGSLPRAPAQAAYLARRDRLDRGAPEALGSWIRTRTDLESEWLQGQESLEAIAAGLARSRPELAAALLTALALGRARQALQAVGADAQQ